MLLSQKLLLVFKTLRNQLFATNLFKHAIQFFSSISFQIGPELIGAFSTKK
jgi:hypothetical protein